MTVFTKTNNKFAHVQKKQYLCAEFAIMKHRIRIIILILSGFITGSALAQNYEREVKLPRLMWTERPNRQTGLFTTRNYFVAPGVSINASAMYYYGDVDNIGAPLNGGINAKNFSAALSLYYQHPISNHCNLRIGMTGGFLNANNKEKFDALQPDSAKRTDYRKFQSIIVQPFVGVQYYPFSQAGFYLYGGVGVTASFITNYEFIHYTTHEVLKGNTFGILPMVQLGIGYSWLLSTSWTLSAEMMLQQGLCDEYYFNLDAYPLAASQSSNGECYGTGGLWYMGADKKYHFKWADGWFQVGITLTYQWRNCETCRTINNYAGIKKRRH